MNLFFSGSNSFTVHRVLLIFLLAGCKKGGDVASIPLPPSAPTNLAVTIISASQIDLSWTDNADNENGFKIERKAEAGIFAEIATVPANTTAYSDLSIAKNTAYTYRLRAFNSVGASNNFSNEVSVTSIDEAPQAVTSLKAVALSHDRIRIEWSDNATNETNYLITRKWGNTDSVQFSLPANAMNFTDTALMENTGYTYKVFPKNNYGTAAPATITLSTPPNIVSGLVAYYPFHGNAQDSSGYGHHGIVSGATLAADRSGKAGEAYYFNTDSVQFITVDASPALNNCRAITLSMWVRLRSYNRQGQLGFNHFVNKSDQDNQHQFIMASNYQGIYFYYGSGDDFFQTQTLPALNEWHHVAISYSVENAGDAFCKIYLDGNLTERFPITKPLPVTDFPLKFGSFANFGNSTLDGWMDDIRIYDRALSASAIQYMYSH